MHLPHGEDGCFEDSNGMGQVQKGDRKGPHPSSSSTPASTMTTNWLLMPISFIVERIMGRDPCGRLSPDTSARHYQLQIQFIYTDLSPLAIVPQPPWQQQQNRSLLRRR